MSERRNVKHPSGRPIVEDRRVSPPFWRIPPDGPLTPRLQVHGLVHAVGFTSDLVSREDDE